MHIEHWSSEARPVDAHLPTGQRPLHWLPVEQAQSHYSTDRLGKVCIRVALFHRPNDPLGKVYTGFQSQVLSNSKTCRLGNVLCTGCQPVSQSHHSTDRLRNLAIKVITEPCLVGAIAREQRPWHSSAKVSPYSEDHRPASHLPWHCAEALSPMLSDFLPGGHPLH